MKRKGTVGSFRRAAQRAGMTTRQYANKILSNPKRYSKRRVAQARLAKTLMKFNKKKG